MEPRTSLAGFVCSPAALSSATSPFTAAVTTGRTRLPSSRVARRGSRARVLALGGAPPPPPAEPEEGEPAEGAPGSDDDAGASEEVTADDILNSPSFLKKKLEIVQKELIDAKAALEQDSDAITEEKDRYVRLAADFENYRRRSADDLRKQDAKSTAKVCKEILVVLDDFERAIQAVVPQSDRETTINNSYQAISKQLVDALSKLKVMPIEAIGNVFDPELHEAIQKLESAEHPEDVVCAQYQRGYMIDETLIRAAVVAVSSGPGPEKADGANGNGAADAAEGEEGVANGAAGTEVETAGGQ